MAGFALAVDIGGTKILTALVRDDGTVVSRSRVDTPGGVEPVLQAVIDTVDEVMQTGAVPRQQVIDRAGLLLGYAGVYGSFLLHAERAADRYNVPVSEILLELGRRQVVGGQEDMIIDVALELARKHAEAEVTA